LITFHSAFTRACDRQCLLALAAFQRLAPMFYKPASTAWGHFFSRGGISSPRRITVLRLFQGRWAKFSEGAFLPSGPMFYKPAFHGLGPIFFSRGHFASPRRITVLRLFQGRWAKFSEGAFLPSGPMFYKPAFHGLGRIFYKPAFHGLGHIFFSRGQFSSPRRITVLRLFQGRWGQCFRSRLPRLGANTFL
jgi:hypothetical protein